MNSNEEFLNRIVIKLKKAAQDTFRRGDIEGAQIAISTCARILYEANPYYADNDLEGIISRIADTLPEIGWKETQSESVLFYDGFGVNSRGLIQIYLKALCKIRKVIYVVHESKKAQIPDVLRILEDSGATIVFLSGEYLCAIMEQIDQAFKMYASKHAFLYTYPHDVPALAAFEHQAGRVIRYQINLTDHAFWLGRNSFDYCVEFRDYGACISRDFRKIPEKKIVKLPFYPSIDFTQPFEGFPLELPEGAKLVFSGGALYKTLGGENRYYKIVEFILRSFPEAVFWYAGFGESAPMNELLEKYPGRVYLTAERKDLFQVLEHSFLYLSTYPLCGGLMFQYAASAGKIPVTLKYDNVSDDFLLNQDALGIEFTTQEAVEMEIEKLFTDDAYRRKKEAQVKSSVVSQAEFEKQLEQLISSQTTGYPVKLKVLDTQAFRREYMENLKKRTVLRFIGKRKNHMLFRYLPAIYLQGLSINLKERIQGR